MGYLLGGLIGFLMGAISGALVAYEVIKDELNRITKGIGVALNPAKGESDDHPE
jgi:ABC-type uncharacterized transport system permease subunit